MLQALREERAVKAKALHDLVHNKDITWNDTHQKTYDDGMSEIDALDGKIKRINDSNRLLADQALEHRVIDSAQRIAKDNKSEGARIFANWVRGGIDGLNAEDQRIFRNALAEGTNSSGGYTVATEVAKNILDALKQFGGMRAVSNVIQTLGGNPMSYPTSDGTSEMGEIVAENASASTGDPTFGTIGLPVYKYSSKIIAIPFELLQDSEADMEAFINKRLRTRLGRITNNHFTVGTGSSQPNGVLTAAGIGKTGLTGQTTTFIYDDVVDLQHSVDPAYREGGNCRFMMADSSVRVARKIKDTTGRPIFAPGYDNQIPGASGSVPDRLLGDPIQVNQDVPTMAANALSMAYGNFDYYTIRDVMDVQMFRFTDSAYASKGQVGFLAWMRAGGNLTDVGGAVKTYKNSAT